MSRTTQVAIPRLMLFPISESLPGFVLSVDYINAIKVSPEQNIFPWEKIARSLIVFDEPNLLTENKR